MTICEYIREHYMEYINTPDSNKTVLINMERGTYEYFKTFCEYVCGGGWDYQLKKQASCRNRLMQQSKAST